MLDVSHEERYLFQQDVNAKEKYEGEQKTANVSSVKLGGGNDFPYDANLEGMTVENHERNYCAVGELSSFSEDPAEWENVGADLRRCFAEKRLEQDLDSLNLRTSARTYDDGRTRYLNKPNFLNSYQWGTSEAKVAYIF